MILKPILKYTWLASIFLLGMEFWFFDCILKLGIWPERSKLIIDFFPPNRSVMSASSLFKE